MEIPCAFLLAQEKQAEMLKDPNVARAILQTLEGSQGGASYPAAVK